MVNLPQELYKFDLSNHPSLQSAVEALVSDALSQDKNIVLLGRGGSWSAYELEHEGKLYAVKISNGKTHTPEATLRSAQNLPQNTDTTSLEHLVGVDIERGIIVSNRVPGKRLVDLTPVELDTIPEKHFTAALEQIASVTAFGVKFDPKPTNYLYDSKSGFGFVDICIEELDSINSPQYLLRVEDGVTGLACALQNVGTYSKFPSSDTEKKYAIESIESGIRASNKLTDVATDNHNIIPPTSIIGILSFTRKNAESMGQVVAHYKADLGQGPRPPAPDWARGL